MTAAAASILSHSLFVSYAVHMQKSDDERFRIQMNMKSTKKESFLKEMRRGKKWKRAAYGGSIFINFHICILLYIYMVFCRIENIYMSGWIERRNEDETKRDGDDGR